MLSSEHIKETQILLTAFQQYGYNIKCFKPNYDNYIKIIQFSPTILLMEFPTHCSEQLKFITLIRSHPKIKKIPVFAYGQERAEKDISFFKNNGLSKYFERPLKFSEILNSIKLLLPEEVKELKKNENAIDDDANMDMFRNPEIAPLRKLSILTAHASNFLAFPFAVARALVVSNDPKSGASDLANTIMSDPVISSQILKMSNTVFYARSGERIASIKDAIVRIGFNETRRLVLCVGVMEMFEKDDRTYGFDRKKFWLHSIAVAVIAEYLVSRSKYKEYAEFGFLCGLLHDFGTIALDEFLSELFTEIVEDAIDKGGSFGEVFKEKIGFLPQDIAEEFFTQWKLPQPIISSCSFKKLDQENLSTKSIEEMLLLSVHAANNIAKALSIGLSCDQVVVPVPNRIADMLLMTAGFTNNVLDRIYQNLSEIIQFLKIEESMISSIKKNQITSTSPDVAYYELSAQYLPLHYMHMKSVDINVAKMKGPNNIKDFSENGKVLVLYNIDGEKMMNGIVELNNQFKESNLKILLLTNQSEIFEENSELANIQVMEHSFDARLIEQKVNELLNVE